MMELKTFFDINSKSSFFISIKGLNKFILFIVVSFPNDVSPFKPDPRNILKKKFSKRSSK